MKHLPTGIVLPAEVLTSDWFILLLTMVALNTIIYVGLTVAKLIPMPHQLHPGRLRGWARTLGMNPQKDTAVRQIPEPEPVKALDPFEDKRSGTVRRDLPLAFAISGVLVVLVATAGLIAFGALGIALHLVEMSTGVLLIICAQLFALRPFRAETITWAWAVACVLLVGLSVGRAHFYESPYPLVYAYIIMTAFAPLTGYWRPSIAAGVLMLAGLVTATQLTQGAEGARLVIAGVAALLVSAMLLQMRLRSLAAQSDEEAKSRALVTTDVLTGTLTPRGLLTIMPTVATIAERIGDPVCLMYVTVPDLTAAKRQYGSRYGDDVLRAVAKILQTAVRKGDLVAHWREGEFLVAGVGGRPKAEELARRLREGMRTSGVNLGKLPTTVMVGTAAGDPGETTFDELLSKAIGDCAMLEPADATAAESG